MSFYLVHGSSRSYNGDSFEVLILELLEAGKLPKQGSNMLVYANWCIPRTSEVFEDFEFVDPSNLPTNRLRSMGCSFDEELFL